MKTIVTAEEVIQLAFSAEEHYAPTIITQEDIVEAEYEYIIPILGQALFDALCQGRYTELRDGYVAPAIAASLRASLEPLLAQRSVACHQVGVVSAADIAAQRRSLIALRRKARTLRRRLSDYVEANVEAYPEYDSSFNPLNRCSIDGNIIQVY